MKTTYKTVAGAFAVVVLSLCSCVSGDGAGGEVPIDCGEHGTAHGGHCHCDQGFLNDGATCVSPDVITEMCEEHDADAGAEDIHRACVCPASGTCPCDGEVESIGGKEYCLPELDG